VINNDRRSGTEATTSTQTDGHGPNEDVDVVWRRAVQFRQSATVLTDHSNRLRLVQDQAELVALLELDLEASVDFLRCSNTHDFREIEQSAIVLENTLGNNEPSTDLSTLPSMFPLNSVQNALKIRNIVVRVPFNGTTTNLHALLNRKVGPAVSDNDIATLGKGWDD
jgi:hypothetical protein